MGDAGGRGRHPLTRYLKTPAWLRPTWPGVVVSLALLAAAAVVLELSRRLWFFGDDWDFLLYRSITGPARLSLLTPHNEHWVTLPIIEYRLIYAVFGLRYLPFAAFVVACHLVACAAWYAVLRRFDAATWAAVIATVAFAFVGAAAEDLLWDFQSEFIAPVALALLALLLVESGVSPRAEVVGAWVLLVAGLMCSGVGISMVCWVSVYVLARRGAVRAIIVGAAPTLVYVLWFLTYGHSAARETPDWVDVPSAMLTGAAHIWGQVFPLPDTGGPIFLLLVVSSLFTPGPAPLRALARAGMVALVPFLLLICISRTSIAGDDAATASRYVYIGMALTLPAFALTLTWLASALVDETVVLRIAGGGLAAALVVTGVAQLHQFSTDRRQLTGDARGRLAAAIALAGSGKKLISHEVDQTYSPNLRLSDLRSAQLRRHFPTVRYGPQARLDAAAGLQVTVRQRPIDVGSGSPKSMVFQGAGAVQADGRCLRGNSQGGYLDLFSGGQGRQVQLNSDATQVVTYLVKGSRVSLPQTWVVAPGEPLWIGTSAHRVHLRVELTATSLRACL